VPTRRWIGNNLPSVPDLLTPALIAGVAELTEPVATKGADPPGGAAAALVVALAASVTAAVAERSRAEWEQAGAIRAQAQALRRRALDLARRNAAAYAEARRQLAARAAAGSQAKDWQLGQAVSAAAEPLQDLAACARDMAQLAELLARHAHGDARPDAVAAAMLSAGAARAAAHLVQINLVAGADEERLADARDQALEADRAAGAASQIR
jgi:formiminotetrahydrofolate cyclodeaminase